MSRSVRRLAVVAVVVAGSLAGSGACSGPRPPWATSDEAPGAAAGQGSGSQGAAWAGDPELARAMNLGFEDGDPPAAWEIRGPHRAAAAERAIVHGGRQSLRVELAGDGTKPTAIRQELSIERVRGKRVRLAAWLRSDELDGQLGIWLRADGADQRVLAFAGSHREPITGTTDWVRREAYLDVPADAQAFPAGIFAAGGGTFWIDDVELAIVEATPAAPVAVQGQVLDAAGAPVAGALVAAVQPRKAAPAQVVITDAGGRFAVDVLAGEWAFTATSSAGVAAYAEVREITEPSSVDLQLGDRGITVRATVEAGGPLPRGLRLHVTRISNVEGDIFVADVGPTGEVALRLPVAEGYSLVVTGDGVRTEPVEIAGDADRTIALSAAPAPPAPDDVVAWLRGAARPLAGADPTLPADDLRALDPLVAGARIVALGEATHGTREFFQLKHRALQYLVEHAGVRWFAIEANQPEARKVDEYITTGAGSAAEALRGMYFWTWNTEEVLAMIEWMRAYNVDPRHREKLRFAGFDMQTTTVAWPAVTAYLAKVDPAYAASLPARLAIFADPRVRERWPSLAADERAALRADLAAVVARFDRERARWSDAGGADAWAVARQDARVVEQAAAMFDAGDSGSFEARDRAMAENVEWLLARAGTAAPLVLWAHNGHIARERSVVANLGSLLAARHGAAYRAIGFVFADGVFQAIDAEARRLRAIELGPPPPSDLSSAFVRAGLATALVDLRPAPAGAIADWLAAPHAMREIGSTFFDEWSMTRPQPLAKRFDAVMFVAHTTRARPNAPRE